ncbi:class I SAM-dependent methyltransferase [Spirochaeta lutea]|uniref:class I SAM-dependent methyltransferase n=1 Tax=Spirochaeta lutea TaxID=1480694 RepID=UPI000689A82C|nr:class I SAM-dependent methyltransferase [Spirochaeta lutea]
MVCTLCGESSGYYAQVIGRDYYSCPGCGLVFMDPGQRLNPLEEKDRYTMHENHIPDPGYLHFLDTLLEPLMEFIPRGSTGLDYGSGPYPMLAQVMTDRGYSVEIFDPFFAPRSPRSTDFSWVSCCEVAEHFYKPLEDWERLASFLAPRGVLGVRTNLVKPDMTPGLFQGWHYPRDPTHVSLYRQETMAWLARHLNLEIIFQNPVTTIFRAG